MVIEKTNQFTQKLYDMSAKVHSIEDKSYVRDFYRGSKHKYYCVCRGCNEIKLVGKYKSGIGIDKDYCEECWNKIVERIIKERVEHGTIKDENHKLLQARLKEMDFNSEVRLREKEIMREKQINLIIKYAIKRAKLGYSQIWDLKVNTLLNSQKLILTKMNTVGKKQMDNSSYIYIMEDRGIYKIGKSNDVKKRLKQMKTGNPYISILYKEFVKDWVESESYLHKIFKNKRINGEWFELDMSDIDKAKNYLENAKLKPI